MSRCHAFRTLAIVFTLSLLSALTSLGASAAARSGSPDWCDGRSINSVSGLRAIEGVSNATFCIASSASQPTGRYEIGNEPLEPGNNVKLIGEPVVMSTDGYGHNYAVKAPTKIHGTGPAVIDLGRNNSATLKNLDLSGASGSCSSTQVGSVVTGGANLGISYTRIHEGFNQGIGHFSGATFDHVEVDGNGSLCLSGHSTGGIKTGSSKGYTISASYVHDNIGPGIWCDVNCDNFNVIGNVSARNSGQGIRYEHSAKVSACSTCNASILHNLVADNGLYSADEDRVNAGIGVSSSENAEIAYNTFGGNYNRNGIILQDGRHPLKNIEIHHSTLKGERIKSCSKEGVTCTAN